MVASVAISVCSFSDLDWNRFYDCIHIAIYACGLLAGIFCRYLILATTFGHDATAQNASVKRWGFPGPLGAFIAAWGGVAMIISAPFVNWWHNVPAAIQDGDGHEA